MDIVLGDVHPISEPRNGGEGRWLGRKRVWGCLFPAIAVSMILGGLLVTAVRHARNEAMRAQDT